MTKLNELELELLRFCDAHKKVLQAMIDSPLNGEYVKDKCAGGIVATDSIRNVIVEQFKKAREQ